MGHLQKPIDNMLNEVECVPTKIIYMKRMFTLMSYIQHHGGGPSQQKKTSLVTSARSQTNKSFQCLSSPQKTTKIMNKQL